MGLSAKKMRRKAELGVGKIWALSAAAAAVALGGASHQASAQTWADPAAVQPQLTNPGPSTTWTSTVALKDGDAIKLPGPTVAGSMTQGATYFVIGNGSTPSTTFRLSATPGGSTILAAPTAAQTTPIPVVQATNWNVAANWGGTIPNATDAIANFNSDTNTAVYTYTGGNTLAGGPYGTVMITKNTTVGTINFSATAGDLILQSTVTGNTGPFAAMTFATSSGTPTINVSGGKGLWFSDMRPSGTGPTLNNSDTVMVIDGTQGLTINNSNPFGALPSPGTGTTVGVASTAGSVKFGYGIDWSGFSGTLTLASGAFAPQSGGSSSGLSALPMNNDVVLGTGTSTAQLELFGNTPNTFLRGLDGNAQSVVINSSTGGGPALTLGNYSQPGDSYTFAGAIGTTTPPSALATGSTPTAMRIVKIGAGQQVLSGANQFQNANFLVINGGTLSLGTTGTIGSAATPTVGVGTQTMSMHNGEFKMIGTSAQARTETLGILQYSNGNSSGSAFAGQSNGQSTITLPADPAQPNTLTFASLNPRNISGAGTLANANGQTTIYQGSKLGSTPGNGVATIKFTTAPAAITGTSGTTNYNVLKGALAIDTFNNLSGFATYDPTNGIRILAASEQDTTDGYPTATTVVNTRLNLTAGTTTVANGVTTQTLQLDNTSGNPQTLTVNGTAINASSGFLFSGTSGVTLNGASTVTGTAAADNEDVAFLSSTASSVTANIAIPVTNGGTTNKPGWITYGGTGNFNITGTQTAGSSGGIAFNSTGGATLAATASGVSSFAVNQGTVSLATGASIASTPDLLVAPGATFDFAGLSAQGAAFNRIDTNAVYQSAGAALAGFNGGGTVTNSGALMTLTLSGTTITTGVFPGVISGNLNLSMLRNSGTAGGTEVLSGVNTYTGSTTIADADILVVGRYGQLPSGTSVTLGAGTLTGQLELGDTGAATDGAVNQTVASISAPVATSSIIGGNINVSVLTVNDSTPDSYAGLLGTPTAPGNANNLQIRQIGAGSLALTNSNSYTGGTVISNGGVLSVASDNTTGAAAPLGALYFPSGTTAPSNPASAVLNNIVIDGGTLQVTGSTTINPLRGIGIGQMTGSANSTATIDVPNASSTVNYGGVIASAGNTGTDNLTKVGLGALNLSGVETYNGNTTVSNGSMNVTGSLANNSSANVFIQTDPDGVFNSGVDISLTRVTPASYVGFGSTEVGGLASSADLKQGINSSGADTGVTMKWRQRSTGEANGSSASLPSTTSYLASDVFDLTNMANAGTASGQTDPFALQMSYTPALAPAGGSLSLVYLAGGTSWVNAIGGDFGGPGANAVAGFSGSYSQFVAFELSNSTPVTDGNLGNFLGSYGVDLNGDTAWAIVNHNSDFSVLAVPEPGSVGILLLGSAALLRRRRRTAAKAN